MKQKQNVIDILAALDSVKHRLKIAMDKNDLPSVYTLGADMAALECCLQYQVKEMLRIDYSERKCC